MKRFVFIRNSILIWEYLTELALNAQFLHLFSYQILTPPSSNKINHTLQYEMDFLCFWYRRKQCWVRMRKHGTCTLSGRHCGSDGRRTHIKWWNSVNSARYPRNRSVVYLAFECLEGLIVSAKYHVCLVRNDRSCVNWRVVTARVGPRQLGLLLLSQFFCR